MFHSNDGGFRPGDFKVDITSTPAQAYSHGNRRLQDKPKWYYVAAGLLCADVHGQIAGAITLEVEPQPPAPPTWTARARGFLAVVIHEIKSIPTESDAQAKIVDWWAQVRA